MLAMSATVYLELSRHLISCNSGGNKKCSLQHRTQREQVPTIGSCGSGGLRILAEPAKRKAAGGESLRTSSNAPMRCKRTQSLLSTTPKHLFFFSDLPEHPLRKEWTALENGVRTPGLSSKFDSESSNHNHCVAYERWYSFIRFPVEVSSGRNQTACRVSGRF